MNIFREIRKTMLKIRTVGTNGRRKLSSLTNEQVRKLRKKIFVEEKERQTSLITRMQKIEVKCCGYSSTDTMMMNKNLSTPYNCAMHIHELFCQQSVIAEVNGKLWDIHRPLTEDCELKFHNFKSAPELVNKVFWRSCSFLLGYVIERALKDKYFVELHSWPKPNVQSGSYVYDADLKVPNWNPTPDELRALTVMMWRLGGEDYNFERLEVKESLALQMFEHNRFKRQQIPDIARSNPEKTVTLYKVNDHIDLSYGPMIGSTKFLGTTQVTSVHQLDTDCAYRFQAISIPKSLPLSSFAFSVLVERAKKLNTTGLILDEEQPREAEENI